MVCINVVQYRLSACCAPRNAGPMTTDLRLPVHCSLVRLDFRDRVPGADLIAHLHVPLCDISCAGPPSKAALSAHIQAVHLCSKTALCHVPLLTDLARVLITCFGQYFAPLGLPSSHVVDYMTRGYIILLIVSRCNHTKCNFSAKHSGDTRAQNEMEGAGTQGPGTLLRAPTMAARLSMCRNQPHHWPISNRWMRMQCSRRNHKLAKSSFQGTF